MSINVMVDIETMGVGLKPALLSIAAIAFDEEGSEVSEFEVGVNLASCIFAGLDVNMSTIEFWKGQSEEAQKALMEVQFKSLTLGGALGSLFKWTNSVKEKHPAEDFLLWGNGMISDNVWLLSASNAIGLDMSEYIKHYEHACYRQEMRNCKKIYGINPHKEIPFIGVEHDAMDDTRHQVRALVTYWNMQAADSIGDDWEMIWNEALYGKDE